MTTHVRNNSGFTHAVLSFALLACCASAIVLSDETSYNNGQPGYVRQSNIEETRRAGFILRWTFIRYSFLGMYKDPDVEKKDLILTDEEFESLISTNFFNAGTPRYSSMIISMTQCYSGGFIDELEGPPLRPAFSINTSSTWRECATAIWAGGGEWGPRGLYDYAWWNTVGFPNMLMEGAYLGALTDPSFPQADRNKQKPQYFASDEDQNFETLNAIPGGRDIALIFVGDDRKPRTQNRRVYQYLDAKRMYDRIVNFYAWNPANIRVYYHNGTRPPGAPEGLPIDGEGSKANFESFFEFPPGWDTGDTWDKVFIWTSGHGGLENRSKPDAPQPEQIPDCTLPWNPNDAVVCGEFVRDSDLEFFEAALDSDTRVDLFLHVRYIDIPDGVPPVRVYLNDELLGVVSESGDTLDIDPNIMRMQNNAIRFEGDASGIELGGFSVNVVSGDHECEDDGCPDPERGACCLEDGRCVVTTEPVCLTAPGVYGGPSTLCAADAPPLTSFVDLFDGPCLLWNVELNSQAVDFDAQFDSSAYVITDITPVVSPTSIPFLQMWRDIVSPCAYVATATVSWDHTLHPGDPLDVRQRMTLHLFGTGGFATALIDGNSAGAAPHPRINISGNQVAGPATLPLAGQAMLRFIVQPVDAYSVRYTGQVIVGGDVILENTDVQSWLTTSIRLRTSRSSDPAAPFTPVRWEHFVFGPTAATCPGDLSGDGLRNGADVQGFVDCMVASPVGCCLADVNSSNAVDVADIAPFVALLLDGAPCP